MRIGAGSVGFRRRFEGGLRGRGAGILANIWILLDGRLNIDSICGGSARLNVAICSILIASLNVGRISSISSVILRGRPSRGREA